MTKAAKKFYYLSNEMQRLLHITKYISMASNSLVNCGASQLTEIKVFEWDYCAALAIFL